MIPRRAIKRFVKSQLTFPIYQEPAEGASPQAADGRSALLRSVQGEDLSGCSLHALCLCSASSSSLLDLFAGRGQDLPSGGQTCLSAPGRRLCRGRECCGSRSDVSSAFVGAPLWCAAWPQNVSVPALIRGRAASTRWLYSV